jgi:SSS family solute:Na+ symporter
MEILALVVFGLILLGMAVWGYKVSAKTAEDYMLAGRGLGLVVMFFFALFAISSVWTFYGYPGFLYRNGPSFVYFVWGCLAGFVGLYMFIGPRMWAVSRLNRFLSPVEAVAARYESPALRLLFTIVILAAMIPYVSDQCLGVGLGFEAMTGFPKEVGILYTSGLLVMIVLLGGMRLTAWVNIFLGVLYSVSFLGALLWVLFEFFPGGPSDAVALLQANRPDLLAAPGPAGRFTPDFTVGVFFAGLLAIGWPHVVISTMTSVDKMTFKWMPVLGLFIAGFFFYSIPFVFGAILAPAIGFHPDGKATPYLTVAGETKRIQDEAAAKGTPVAEDAARAEASEIVRNHADKIVQSTVTHYLPRWFSIFVLFGVLGAAISTAAVQLMTSSILIARDLVHGFLKPDASDRTLIRVTKASVIGVLVLSTLVAYWYPIELALYLVNVAVPGFAQWVPALVGGILWRRGTRAGALAGGLAGSLYLFAGVILSVVLFGPAELSAPRIFLGKNPAIPTLAINLVLYVVVSLLTPRPSESVQRRFFDEVESFLAKKG